MTGLNVSPSYTSTDTPVAIPDDNPTGASSVIAVPDVKTVTDVNLTVNITHTFDGDISLYLIGPNGAQVELSIGNGGSGQNYTNTVFDDEATTPIGAGSPPFTGSFQPQQPLSTFDGITAAGNWTFKVVDNYGWDVGTIDSWTLNLTYPAASCPDTPLFTDDFESGNAAAWSHVVP